MSSRQNNPANFANRPKDEVQAIASKGGRSHTGNTAGTRSGKSKRGFASMDPKKQHEIASKGGKASGQSRSSGKAEDELS
ncbi:conidiation-specific protein 10 [Rhizopus microsporus]|uniref:Conidiation-specific protein 10 n=1 Tax=Rhizopus microsporus TaxID=58291 RepID=A0A1X0RQJ8_RHIZD|nr:conidiation-specific protein 10 [Rhizopus microsporus]